MKKLLLSLMLSLPLSSLACSDTWVSYQNAIYRKSDKMGIRKEAQIQFIKFKNKNDKFEQWCKSVHVYYELSYFLNKEIRYYRNKTSNEMVALFMMKDLAHKYIDSY